MKLSARLSMLRAAGSSVDEKKLPLARDAESVGGKRVSAWNSRLLTDKDLLQRILEATRNYELEGNRRENFQLCELRRAVVYLSNRLLLDSLDNPCSSDNKQTLSKIAGHVHTYLKLLKTVHGESKPAVESERFDIDDERDVHKSLKAVGIEKRTSELHDRFKQLGIRPRISSRFMFEEALKMGLHLYVDVAMQALQNDNQRVFLRCVNMFDMYRRITTNVDAWYQRIEMKMNLLQGKNYQQLEDFEAAKDCYIRNTIIWSSLYLMHNNIGLRDVRHKVKLRKANLLLLVSLMSLFNLAVYTCDPQLAHDTVMHMRFVCECQDIDVVFYLMTSAYEKQYIKILKKLEEEKEEMLEVLSHCFQHFDYREEKDFLDTSEDHICLKETTDAHNYNIDQLMHMVKSTTAKDAAMENWTVLKKMVGLFVAKVPRPFPEVSLDQPLTAADDLGTVDASVFDTDRSSRISTATRNVVISKLLSLQSDQKKDRRISSRLKKMMAAQKPAATDRLIAPLSAHRSIVEAANSRAASQMSQKLASLVVDGLKTERCRPLSEYRAS